MRVTERWTRHSRNRVLEEKPKQNEAPSFKKNDTASCGSNQTKKTRYLSSSMTEARSRGGMRVAEGNVVEEKIKGALNKK